MTLCVVFQRSVNGYRELVFCSDSRLCDGQRNDCAQKVFEVGRSDCLIAFAGDTKYAYPLLLQIFRSIETYPQSESRRLPLGKLKGHVLSVFRQVYSLIHGLPVNQSLPDDPDNYFLMGGYDWTTNEFKAWRIYFDPKIHKFVANSVASTEGKGNGFRFVGDDYDAISEAVSTTFSLLRERGRDRHSIDTEPLEALASVIRGGKYSSIGGALQVGKTYQHLNTQMFQVLWLTKDGTRVRHVAGRPLRSTERCSWPVYDPDKGFYSIRASASSAE